jgi:alpha-1,2-mannosyltransferase
MGSAVIFTLAGFSIVLLSYESYTLVTAVWRPLLANPRALQTDFHYFYEAASRFASSPSDLYLPTDHVMHGFMYPPPAIVPFVWLSKWPLGSGLLALTITSYVMLIAAVQCWIAFLCRTGHRIDARSNIAMLLVALALGPTYMNAVFGQVNVFVLASSVLFATFAVTAPIFAGALLAAGSWLKIYPLLVATIVLWNRRAARAIGWALVASLAIVIVLLPVVPLEMYSFYFFQVLPNRGSQTSIHVINQSLTAFMERFQYQPGQFLYWTDEQLVTADLPIRVMNWLFLAAAICWLAKRARAGAIAAATAGVMALVAVAAPVGWGHTYVMAVPLVTFHLATLRNANTAKALVICFCVAAMMVPAGRHLPFDSFPGWVQNIVYSRYLFATITLMVLAGYAKAVGGQSTPLEPTPAG